MVAFIILFLNYERKTGYSEFYSFVPYNMPCHYYLGTLIEKQKATMLLQGAYC